MRIQNIFLSIFILVGFLSSCSDPYEEKDVDRGTQESLLSTTSVYSVSSIERVVDFSTFFISGINENNGIVEYSISSFVGAQDITVQIIGDELKIEDITKNRSLVFNKFNKTITYYEGLVSTDITNKYIDDLLYIYYNYSKDENNNENSVNSIISPNDNGPIHTAMSIQWRKSLAIEGCERLINDYLKDHPECSQLGGIDTWCIFGDFGCVAIGEIQC